MSFAGPQYVLVVDIWSVRCLVVMVAALCWSAGRRLTLPCETMLTKIPFVDPSYHHDLRQTSILYGTRPSIPFTQSTMSPIYEATASAPVNIAVIK